MKIFAYKKGAVELREDVSTKELPMLLADEEMVLWIDLDVRDSKDLKIAEDLYVNVFKFHRLTVEDCREYRNQPKAEAFAEYLFFIVHGVKTKTNTANFVTKELSGYLGKNFVVTNRNDDFRTIEAVQKRIRKNPTLLDRGAAFLLHQIFDQLVDNYMAIVDDFDNAINELENRVYLLEGSENTILEEIMDVRRSVAHLKRISTRQLDVFYRISHGEFSQIPEEVLPFYRNVHDHLLRISDIAESYRDIVNGLFEIHFSVTASKTNDVMKFLALVSATMLPLTLLTGIYGMNFDNLPLIHSRYGYIITVGLMLSVVAFLLFYFWRRGWFTK